MPMMFSVYMYMCVWMQIRARMTHGWRSKDNLCHQSSLSIMFESGSFFCLQPRYIHLASWPTGFQGISFLCFPS